MPLPSKKWELFDTEEVAGSNPVVPTIYFQWFTGLQILPQILLQPKGPVQPERY
jgi:hypothetical protein